MGVGPLRVIAYGAGVQSTSLLVLAAQRQVDFPVFLFANVGDDSEHPATLQYLRCVAMPYAAAHGIVIREPRRLRRDGTVETLYGRLTKPGSPSIPIAAPAEGFGRQAQRTTSSVTNSVGSMT